MSRDRIAGVAQQPTGGNGKGTVLANGPPRVPSRHRARRSTVEVETDERTLAEIAFWLNFCQLFFDLVEFDRSSDRSPAACGLS
jgi:hypothetical protein